jgi:hypothetical protein
LVSYGKVLPRNDDRDTHTFGHLPASKRVVKIACVTASDENAPTRATERTVVDWEVFDRLTSQRGWTTDYQRARALGIEQSTLTKLRAGTAGAGPRVIDACLRVFGGVAYDMLFRRERVSS